MAYLFSISKLNSLLLYPTVVWHSMMLFVTVVPEGCVRAIHDSGCACSVACWTNLFRTLNEPYLFSLIMTSITDIFGIQLLAAKNANVQT